MSRILEILSSTPLVTLSVILLNTFVFAFEFLASIPQKRIVFSAAEIVSRGEIGRIFTAAFSHAGILHICMNMMTLASVGGLLEQKLGSVRLAVLNLTSVAAVGSTHAALAYVLYFITRDSSWIYQGSLGYSGVLFHLVVIECSLPNGLQARNLFGIAQVPTWLYPWVLLVLLQFILPSLSLLGHLSGLIIGTLQVWGVGSSFLMPSVETADAIEDWPFISTAASLENFVSCPNEDAIRREVPVVLRRLCAAISLGRNRSSTSSVRLWRLVPLDDDNYDDIEETSVNETYWGGLAPGRTLQPSSIDPADV